MKKILTFFLLSLIPAAASMAQCAMCRTTLENNVSNGDIGIAAGINFGILYLFVAPYLAIATVAYFWFRYSKRNAHKEFDAGHMAG